MLSLTALLIHQRVTLARPIEGFSTQSNDQSRQASSISSLALISDHDNFFQIIDQNEQSITIELTTPQAQIEEGLSNSFACETLNVEGFGNATRSGWPQLPVKGVLIGIPIESAPTLTVLESEAVLLPDRINLCPVAQPVASFDLDGNITFEGSQLIPDPEGYSDLQNLSANPAQLTSTAFLRSQRVAQLFFQPFRYDAFSGQVFYHPQIRVRLDFNSSNAANKFAKSTMDEGFFESFLKDNLLNYSSARTWRLQPSTDSFANTASKDAGQVTYKIMVDQDGLYQITYSDLVNAGVALDTLNSLDPRSLQLINAGVEVAIFVEGEQDGVFDSGDSILFYGQALNTKFTNTNVYWLSWGTSSGLRMEQKDGTPSGSALVPDSYLATAHVEENHYYLSSRPSGPEQDRWVWDYIYGTGAGAAQTRNFKFSINPADIPSSPVSIRGLLRGYQGTPHHHTKVYLNGYLIDDAIWNGENDYNFDVIISRDKLLNGENTITVECPMDGGVTLDIFYINYFDIDYAGAFVADNNLLFFNQTANGAREFRVVGFTSNSVNVFDISDHGRPIRMTGAVISPLSESTYRLSFEATLNGTHQFLALSSDQQLKPAAIVVDKASNLRDNNNRADYLIISHADFLTAIQPLADYRTSQGLTSIVIDVEDIYDEFNFGVFDPQAIRDFIAYAYANWTHPVPTYVLLVGDGHFDFKNYYGRDEGIFIPPYLANIDPWIGETAADNRYVTVSGSDLLPDLFLGRLPVKTAVETTQMVNKILSYEANQSQGNWNQTVMFVADNSDSAGNFANISDNIANFHLPAPYFAQKIYYKVTHATGTEVKTSIIDGINQGRLLINYIGHSSTQFWAAENFLGVADMNRLTNTDRWPFMLPMTCLDGYYISPSAIGENRSSVGESLVASSPNGAIASWSPTGFGVATGHDLLNKGLFNAIFNDDVIALGPATTQAKLNLYMNSSSNRELMDTYILFGDPALKLNVLPADLSLTQTVFPGGALRPGDTLTYTLTYANTDAATAHHVVIEDLLPEMLEDVVVTTSGAAAIQRSGTRFVWDLADLAQGQSGSITITAKIAEAFTGTITNSASITTSAREINRINNVPAAVTTLVEWPTSNFLTSFSATAKPVSILIEWQTSKEDSVTGFNVYRSQTADSQKEQLNTAIIPILPPGGGSGNSYAFEDTSISGGKTYYYWLEIITNANQFLEGPLEVQTFSTIFMPMLVR